MIKTSRVRWESSKVSQIRAISTAHTQVTFRLGHESSARVAMFSLPAGLVGRRLDAVDSSGFNGTKRCRHVTYRTMPRVHSQNGTGRSNATPFTSKRRVDSFETRRRDYREPGGAPVPGYGTMLIQGNLKAEPAPRGKRLWRRPSKKYQL